MKKNTGRFLQISLILTTILLMIMGTGCKNGSYLTPIGMAPYTSGNNGTLSGEIFALSMPNYFFGDGSLLRPVNEEDENENQNEAPMLFASNLRQEYNTRVFSIIRIAGKKYIYDPEIEPLFYISNIPTGFHTIVIEAPGYERYEKTIRIEDKDNRINFQLNHPEILNPNYFRNISNIQFDIIDLNEEEREDVEEENDMNKDEYVKLSLNNLSRFETDKIKVHIDNETLITENVAHYSEDFIDMLGIWETSCDFLDFELTENYEESHFSVRWVENFGTSEVIALTTPKDPYYPEYAYKPVITFGIYLPNSTRKPVEKFRKLIMLREIGHALGLFGSSPNPNDIMYSGDSNIIIEGDIELSDADINTLTMLYQTVPGVSEKSFNVYRGGE
ncbi:MAG: PEGA domain-containing protein [Candidatus Muiribacteriota bacterium]